MTTISHNPLSVEEPLGNYSHGLEIVHPRRLLFISGQSPTLPDGTVPETFEQQCEAVWDNIFAILDSAGMDIEHIVKVTTFLTDREQVEQNSIIRRQRLGDHRPALTVMIAQTLVWEWLLEIEVIAAIADSAAEERRTPQ